MKKLWRKLRWLLAALLLVAVTAGGLLTLEGWQLYRQAIQANPLEQVLAEARAAVNYTTIDQLPQFYLDAVVSVEDRRFYRHNGVDLISIGRAVAADIKARALVEGGSTITQQLAKNLYFTQEKKFERKIAEVFVAWDIENLCNKDEILELYVNNIYFGSGYYCIYDAARGYFNKAPAELDNAECALLAGLPQAPSVYDPRVNPELAARRQQQVIKSMVDCQLLSDEEASGLVAVKLILAEQQLAQAE